MLLRLSALFLFGTTIFFTYAQGENSTHCYKRDKKYLPQTKSASLSVAQIAETEKYDVFYYSLDIAMNNVQTNVAGNGEIHARARVALDSALFELHSNHTISEIRVNGTPVVYSRTGSAIKVPVNANQNDVFVISTDYSGVPPTSATTPFGGGGMTQDSSPSWGNQVTWSLSEPFSAYEWWPCKQSLTDKSDSCSVKITVPDSCKAGSNGILENVVDLGTGFSRYEWKHRHPIDYYLISVSVAKYVDYSFFCFPANAPAPILVQNYIYDNPQTLPYFETRINETSDFIELFYELYGPYAFENEKYGHCMAPISGGMEHQTMTTQGFFERTLTSHELGHQWWGDNVTCASWTDIWVNEGFASYSEYLMLENLYPGDEVQHMADVHNNVMQLPTGSVWVLDSLDEGRIFSGRLTYDKGAAIIHTIRYIVNDDPVFFQILRDFQLQFADSVARGIDIRDFFQNATGIDFTPYFEQWYFGEGYPTYSLMWNEIGGDILLKVTHTASASSVTPTFTNPIDVRIVRPGLSDTIIRLAVTSNNDLFLIDGFADATTMSVDPNNWVVNKVGSVQFNANLVSMEEMVLENDLKVYPNPTTGILNVITGKNVDSEFKVFGMNGQLLKSGIISGQSSIDLNELSNGSYILEVDQRRKLINIAH